MMKKEMLRVVILLALFTVTAYAVIAAGGVIPEPPDTLTYISSGRHDSFNDSQIIEAEAGNVTELTIADTRITQAWQGYFGNVTGTITLDDANNNTLFDWTLPNPTGEVYAANQTNINWGDVHCVNFTNNETQPFNVTTLENGYYINVSDRDGFDETFNSTYTNTTGFQVGSITINNEDGCHMASTFVDEVHQTHYFLEVLLTDNNSLIFAALLEDSIDGYQTGVDQHDFQMLVAENGHPGFEATTTSYYFYVELA